MISRLLARSDERFLHTALSERERTATLADLRRRRSWLTGISFFVLICLAVDAAASLLSHQRVSASGFFVLIILLLMQQEFTSQIRLLEILQHTQADASSNSNPSA